VAQQSVETILVRQLAGYRIEAEGSSLAYLPNHEPALGARRFPGDPEWTSGFDLAHGVDLLIHDAQYTRAEYPGHVGWGHSAIHDAVAFAGLAGVRQLIPFHHDPGRDDAQLDTAVQAAVAEIEPRFPVTPAAEGTELVLG
jgi:phosphoribosyl 1,2-cyclic phosphodiesterase